MKTERTQIRFLSDVLVAVASLDLKAPNDSKGRRSGKGTHLSHHCGPGSNPGVDAICGSSLLLVLSIALRNFFLVLLFSPLSKNQHFQFPIRPGMVPVDEEPLCGQATSKSLFIIYIFYTMEENFLLTNKN